MPLALLKHALASEPPARHLPPRPELELNDPRNISEFASGGEVRAAPDPANCSDLESARHLFLELSPPGEMAERGTGG